MLRFTSRPVQFPVGSIVRPSAFVFTDSVWTVVGTRKDYRQVECRSGANRLKAWFTVDELTSA